MKNTGLIALVCLMVWTGCTGGYKSGEFKTGREQEAVTRHVPASVTENTDGRYGLTNGNAAQKNTMTVALADATRNDSRPCIAEKIIKTGEIRIKVDDYRKSMEEAVRIVSVCNGTISDQNEVADDYRISNDLVIRVANKEFDRLMEGLGGMQGGIEVKRINSEDVTAEFVDIEARLRTKKEIERRYVSLLERAVKIPDILEVEEKIRVIREEIEAKEGQLRYLGDRVSFSTIHLNLHKEYEYTPVHRPGFGNKLVGAFRSGWSGLLGFLLGLAHLWPVIIIAGVTGPMVYRRVRKKGK